MSAPTPHGKRKRTRVYRGRGAKGIAEEPTTHRSKRSRRSSATTPKQTAKPGDTAVVPPPPTPPTQAATVRTPTKTGNDPTLLPLLPTEIWTGYILPWTRVAHRDELHRHLRDYFRTYACKTSVDRNAWCGNGLCKLVPGATCRSCGGKQCAWCGCWHTKPRVSQIKAGKFRRWICKPCHKALIETPPA